MEIGEKDFEKKSTKEEKTSQSYILEDSDYSINYFEGVIDSSESSVVLSNVSNENVSKTKTTSGTSSDKNDEY